MNDNKHRHLLIGATALISSFSWAGFGDWIQNSAEHYLNSSPNKGVTDSAISALSETEIGQALKQALAIGAEQAILTLGQPGGFLHHPQFKIPIPDQLQTVATALKAAGQGQLVDQFENSLNRAAEAAVPLSANIVKQTIQNMSLDDVRNILSGGNTAATDYLIEMTRDPLKEALMPIIQKTTEQNETTDLFKQVTRQYKAYLDLAGNFFAMGMPDIDIDDYIADKTLDALYGLIAKKEAEIRQNPAARTTDILRKVFQ